MFKSGKKVAEHVTMLDGSKVPDEQIQTHGVELTIDKVFKVNGIAKISDDDYIKGERVEAKTVDDGVALSLSSEVEAEVSGNTEAEDGKSTLNPPGIVLEEPHYVLNPDSYVVRYNERISVPDDHVGLVFPRSRLIRNNNFLSTAVWDSGYEGRGEGGLHINCTTFLEKGMRVGQFLLARANVMEQYDGSHQEENLED